MVNNKSPLTAKRVVFTSFLVDATDFVINLLVTIFTGSAIMLAETLQGGFDMTASIFLLLGLSRSKKKRDNIHQFGHGRELYFWTLISALIILLGTGIPSLIAGIHRIFQPEMVENINLAYVVLGIALITNSYSFRLSRSRLLAGETSKNALKVFLASHKVETKGTFILDSIGAISAFSGLASLVLYGLTGEYRFDGVGAAIIGISAIIMALLLISSVKDLLVGRAASPEIERKIRNLISSHSEIKKVLNLRTMYMGPEAILVDTGIYLDKALSFTEAEIFVEKLKEELESQIPQARFIQIEVETPKERERENRREKPQEDY